MSEELKPCPCGGLVYVGSYKFIDATLSGIGCMHCGRTTGMTEAKSEAIAAWNRRASPDARREALEEAAAIAESYMRDLDNPLFARACAENIASRIRALKETKP